LSKIDSVIVLLYYEHSLYNMVINAHEILVALSLYFALFSCL
jgi:hypothetical protein